MELLAIRDDKQIWLHQFTRPYRLLVPPFPGECYAAILLANDPSITPEEQAALSTDLVNTDCRYAVCAGHDCASWDISVDLAYLEKHNYSSGENFVMTSWHEDEPIDDVIFFSLTCTNFDEHDFHHYLILTITPHPGQRAEIQRAINAIWQPTTE